MVYDFSSLTPDDLRARGSVKWNAYPADELPLWVAEMDYPTAPEVQEALEGAVARQVYGYSAASAGEGLAEALAQFSASQYGWNVDPANVFSTPTVLSGVVLALEELTAPGTPIAVAVPCYMPFFEVVKIVGRQIIEVPMLMDGMTARFDLDALDAAFAAGAGSLLISSPYNPIGRAFTAQELQDVVEVAHRHGARIISDEIHAPLVLAGRHVPLASVSEVAAEITVTVTAASKAFNLPGLKCAQVVMTNQEDAAHWRSLSYLRRESASSLGIAASTAAFGRGEAWLGELREVLRNRRDAFAATMQRELPELRTTVPEATYLAWLDLRAFDLPTEPAPWLREHAKVVTNPGVEFGPGGEGHVRLNLATTEPILTEATERIVAALSTG